jgi:hypothetical protein
MLFKTTEEIKNYLPVNTALDFGVISPYIKTAERDYLTRLIGTGLYNEMLAYSDSTTVTDAQNQLLDYAKIAVINLAILEWAKTGTLQMGNMGLTMQEGPNQKVPYKYKEQEFKDSVKTNGFNALDLLLEFLEDNINTFPTFKQSTNYSIFKGHLLNQTREFDEVYFIGGSRLVFLRLQRFITQAEDFDIKPVIGSELYDRIMGIIAYQGSGSGSGSGEGSKDYMLPNPVTDIGKLIKMLIKATAHLSIYKGIADLNVNITEKGLFFESKEGGTGSFSKQTNVLETFTPNENLSSIARNAYKNGTAYLEQARQFLLKYIDSFPEYEDSDSYDEGVGNQRMSFDNTDKNIIRM